MKIFNAPQNRTRRNILVTAFAAAVAVAFMVAPLQPAQAGTITVPPLPDGLGVPAGHQVFLVGHAIGTQNYICLPSGSGFAYTLFTPQATLFNDDGDRQLITHFFSPNLNPVPGSDPSELNKIRATWQDSQDTSRVWAAVLNPATDSSTDEQFVEKDAVAWLKLTAVGTKAGPDGGDRLAETTFVQRLNTSGGVAPKTGCASSADVGRQAFQPYTADYFFYH